MLQRDQYWYGSDPYVTQAGQLDTDGREKVGVSYNFFDVHLKNISYMFRWNLAYTDAYADLWERKIPFIRWKEVVLQNMTITFSACLIAPMQVCNFSESL
jgi:hypothetical protein